MTLPERQGLYDPRHEHDSCGVGFVVDIKNRKSHEIVEQGIKILLNLDHRGAVGADPLAGDGVGILVQMPDEYLRAVMADQGVKLPEVGHYACAMAFLPKDDRARATVESLVAETVRAEGQVLLAWRDVPVDRTGIGKTVLATEPTIRQAFIERGKDVADQAHFERKLFVIRRSIENAISKLATKKRTAAVAGSYFPSFSSRTLVYKGIFLGHQLRGYFKDLQDKRFKSALALMHQRFSTNTFPSWRLAHPYRMICHNGEINTVQGNVNWMSARRHSMKSELFGADVEKLFPLIPPGQSDTACFDNALELMVHSGYTLARAMTLLIPEAWHGNPLMDEDRRAFYEYHAAVMEPWDGPAAIAFTDGRQIGATLDRNGLRPARYIVTEDDMVIMSSEVGVFDIPDEKIVKKWRLQPGKMFLIDLEQGRIIDDAELKAGLAGARPYREWLNRTQVVLEDLPATNLPPIQSDPATLLDRQQAFGYTDEDVKFFLEPMAREADDPVGSMGTDVPISPLSSRSKLLYTYFKQRFAQVTNPPIDSIREELVMSLVSLIGPRPNLLGVNQSGSDMRLEVRQPVLTNEDLEKIRAIHGLVGDAFRTITLDMTWPAEDGADGLEKALDRLCNEAEKAVHGDFNILILSDRAVGPQRIGVPALLGVSAVHHHLIKKGLRTETGIVVETGEVRETHHFAMLAGFGAEAINPYLAFETLEQVRVDQGLGIAADKVQKNYIKAVDKALLKIMSKMGISTYQSYCGAQIFDAVGLSGDFVAKYFTGTSSVIEGVGLDEVAEETVMRHRQAYGEDPLYRGALDPGGNLAYRIRGEVHAWSPETVARLQHAARGNSKDDYAAFARAINDQSERLLTLRGLFKIKTAATPIPLDQVEPAKDIVRRFATGAMSFGSISREAHTTLAIAMNRIGGKSNTGEGGEEPDRFKPLPNGDSMRSAIKQVASGRFGVTAEYLVNADDLQIKMAQGAKPGEGGQLPGHKVDANIARVRHSTPGVGLISPPPHHDIYSIEDLAQLIHDLKNVNPEARVSVKLVSEVGVGTVAAGVSKCRADHVTISGFEGGTGASPLTSLLHAGSPWEIGLAETHQTLVLNRLRGRIAVQVDGGLRTGRDVVIGALLGADEFGFATAPLIAAGCIMMRKCHTNTCPVGVATQDPELRRRFTGQPEHVINYFFFVAEEVRALMAEMGVRRFDELIGRSDYLDMRSAIDHWKAKGVDLSRLLYRPEVGPDVAIRNTERQDHQLEKALDHKLIAAAAPALDHGKSVKIEATVRNVNRTVGAMLSGSVARKYGHAGLPEDTIHAKLSGTAGQSFGAFLARGISLELVGDANDYVGKGLSGGRIAVYPKPGSKRVAMENIIIGNTALYGAIDGEVYVAGVAGERFAVRNSGAAAVIEGVGDHGCEYMTGGVVVVIGKTGRNFAAGMSGGIAYMLDEDGRFERLCNTAMVSLSEIARGPKPENFDFRADPLAHDEARLRLLIERHLHYTGSVRAKEILGTWDAFAGKFVKIVPNDYRKALEAMRALPAEMPRDKTHAAGSKRA